MNFYDASGEEPMVVQYNSDIWVVEGVNETARQVHLRNIRSNKVCLACIACVRGVDHQALIHSAVANIAAKEASRSLIRINGFTPEQMKGAQDRCSIIVRELSGKKLPFSKLRRNVGLTALVTTRRVESIARSSVPQVWRLRSSGVNIAIRWADMACRG